MTSSRRSAWVVAVGLVVLLVWGLLGAGGVPDAAVSGDSDQTDVALYRAIVERMQDGAGYYAAASVEHADRGYPTDPVMTVREPTLAWMTSVVGGPVAYGLLLLLVGAAAVLSLRRFEQLSRSRLEWYGASLVAILTLAYLAMPANVWFHDVWAGLLIYVAVLARSERRPWLAVGLVVVAVLVRELAAPAIVALGFVSWWQGRRREVAWWAGALAVVSAAYVIHAAAVLRLVDPVAKPSPGWLELQGWPFVVDAVWFSTPLHAGPVAVAAVVTVLGVLGWAGRAASGAGAAIGACALLAVFVAAFAVVGRPDNVYWGALFAPVLVPGVAFAPAALAALVRSLRRAVTPRAASLRA